MKQFRLPIFTSKIKIYNLRIVPPSSVFDAVTDFKEQFENEFGKQPLSGSKPHVTIAAFKMNSKHQDFLIQAFSQLSQQNTFKLNIDGFGVFESSKTLYLNISKNNAIKSIHREVQFLSDHILKGKLKSFFISDNPHMTISKTTGKRMLNKSSAHFQKVGYSTPIEVGHLVLVARSKYKTWDWEHRINLSKADTTSSID